jgi:hypothetical protein
MKTSISTVLRKVFVATYYRLNAAFFLLVFLVLFGVIDPGASVHMHYELMLMVGSQPAILLIGIAVWTVYYAKCLLFCINRIAESEQLYLYELQALPLAASVRIFLGMLAGIYAPALVYAGCTVVLALVKGHIGSALAILLHAGAMLATGIAICRARIMNVTRYSAVSKLSALIVKLRPGYISYMDYLSAYAMSSKKLLLLLLKVGSLLLLQLMVAINRDSHEAEGTFYILLFIVTAHGLLPWHFVRFMESNTWLRNLPLTVSRRYLAFAIAYALLFLPELVFLLIHLHTALTLLQMFSFYALALAMLCWLHTMLYMKHIKLENYALLLAAVYVFSIISLTTLSTWLLAAIWMSSSALLFPVLYRRYEHSTAGLND